MDAKVFDKFREIVYEKSGISLSSGKESLVSARVAKRMRALNLDDYKAYLDLVLRDETGEEVVLLLDAISTNVTSFFREPAHFEVLGALLEKWAAAGQKRFRLWSAACSSGEEPYTMGMTVSETLGAHRGDHDVRILATDISTRILRHSMAGVYTKERVQSIPPMLRDRYFAPCRGDNAGDFEVKDSLKSMVTFRRMNLSHTPFPLHGPLDVVFCRNVMIYFDNKVRAALLGEIYRLLKPGGYLFVGHAESLTGMMSSLKSVKPSVYVKPA